MSPAETALAVALVPADSSAREPLVRAAARVGLQVVDTPGMREFGILGADGGIDSSYSDIVALSSRCRYRDCSHTGEPGCAVIAAAHAGEIGPESLENFHKLRKESRFNEMSYAERRKKDRDFGRYIKSVKNDLKNR